MDEDKMIDLLRTLLKEQRNTNELLRHIGMVLIASLDAEGTESLLKLKGTK